MPTKHTEDVMKTIAQAYIEEGEAKLAKALRTTATKLLQQNVNLKLISSVTGFSLEELSILKNDLQTKAKS